MKIQNEIETSHDRSQFALFMMTSLVCSLIGLMMFDFYSTFDVIESPIIIEFGNFCDRVVNNAKNLFEMDI